MMEDLLYFGDEGYPEYRDARELASSLPGWQAQDASDEIHGYRFSLSCSLSEEEYLSWLSEHGLQEHSLTWRMEDISAQMDALVSEDEREGCAS